MVVMHTICVVGIWLKFEDLRSNCALIVQEWTDTAICWQSYKWSHCMSRNCLGWRCSCVASSSSSSTRARPPHDRDSTALPRRARWWRHRDGCANASASGGDPNWKRRRCVYFDDVMWISVCSSECHVRRTAASLQPMHTVINLVKNAISQYYLNGYR